MSWVIRAVARATRNDRSPPMCVVGFIFVCVG